METIVKIILYFPIVLLAIGLLYILYMTIREYVIPFIGYLFTAISDYLKRTPSSKRRIEELHRLQKQFPYAFAKLTNGKPIWELTTREGKYLLTLSDSDWESKESLAIAKQKNKQEAIRLILKYPQVFYGVIGRDPSKDIYKDLKTVGNDLSRVITDDDVSKVLNWDHQALEKVDESVMNLGLESLIEKHPIGAYGLLRWKTEDSINCIRVDNLEMELQKYEDAFLIAAEKEHLSIEQARLYAISHFRKNCANDIQKYLEINGIKGFYHFTDQRNLKSIIENGGLFSWKYCEDNSIQIPFPGGDDLSRSLDRSQGLEDYVRLSFCTYHPMRWSLSQNGRSFILLRIDPKVAGLYGTLFSNINATDNNHKRGGSYDDLRRVSIADTKVYSPKRDDPEFKSHQAEVMVRTFIPLEYIHCPHLVINESEVRAEQSQKAYVFETLFRRIYKSLTKDIGDE